jgi:four helix bundle protein
MREYDLEERTYEFAQGVRGFLKRIPRSPENIEDAKQLIRASGSVGANYLEANGALGKRDFLMRIRIARKEAKESRLFLRLIDPGEDATVRKGQRDLAQEAKELASILGAILKNSEGSP